MNLSDLLKVWRSEKSASGLTKLPPQFYIEAKELLSGKNPYDAKKAQDLYDDIVHMRQHKMMMGCLRHLQEGDPPENLLGSEKETYNRVFKELQLMRSGDVEVVEKTEDPGPETVDGQETLLEAEEGPLPAGQPVTESVAGAKSVEAEMDAPGSEMLVEEEPQVSGKAGSSGEFKVEDMREEPKKSAKSLFKGKTENKALKRVRFIRPIPAFVGPDLQTLGPFIEDEVADLDGEIAEILLKNDAIELVTESEANGEVEFENENI